MLHKITIIILIYYNQRHPNFRLDEKILKNKIHRYISPIDNNNRIRFIIYYKKFRTFNLVVNNNYFPFTKIIEKKNSVINQFKFPLGECISDNKNKIVLIYLLVTPQLNYQGGLPCTYQILAPYINILKKYNYLIAIYRNILVNNAKYFIQTIISKTLRS